MNNNKKYQFIVQQNNKPTEIQSEYPLFEFTLSINDNIICQRHFPLFSLNQDKLKSEEFKDTVNNVVDLIKEYQKQNSFNYLNDKNDRNDLENVIETSNQKDLYHFKIKLFGLKNYNRTYQGHKYTEFEQSNGVVVSHTSFDASVYPPEVRYSLNIRDLIQPIRKNLQKSLVY